MFFSSKTLIERSAVYIALLFALFWAFSAQSEQLHAVTETFYPYQQINQQGEMIGYSVEVVKALSEISGDELNISLLPWSMAYKKALETPNTLIFSIGKNKQRLSLFKWVGKIATERLHFWALSSSNIEYSEVLNDFKSYRIAVVKDATTHQFLSANGFSNLYPMSSPNSNAGEENRIQMMLKGRADIVIAIERGIYSALDTIGQSQDLLKKVYRAKPLDSDLYIAFSADSDDTVVSRYVKALSQFEQSGGIAKLKQKWRID